MSGTRRWAAGAAMSALMAPTVAAHPGLGGVVPLSEGLDAFAARGLLAAAAGRTLDVQDDIRHPDESGCLLLEALWKAAERNGAPAPGAQQALMAQFEKTRAEPSSTRCLETLRTAPFIQQRIDSSLKFEWRRTQRGVDDPAKTLSADPQADELLLTAVRPLGVNLMSLLPIECLL